MNRLYGLAIALGIAAAYATYRAISGLVFGIEVEGSAFVISIPELHGLPARALGARALVLAIMLGAGVYAIIAAIKEAK